MRSPDRAEKPNRFRLTAQRNLSLHVQSRRQAAQERTREMGSPSTAPLASFSIPFFLPLTGRGDDATPARTQRRRRRAGAAPSTSTIFSSSSSPPPLPFPPPPTRPRPLLSLSPAPIDWPTHRSSTGKNIPVRRGLRSIGFVLVWVGARHGGDGGLGR